MIKMKNRHIFNIGDVNNLYGWAMSQKLQVYNFESRLFNLRKIS